MQMQPVPIVPISSATDRMTEGDWEDLLWLFSKGALVPFLGAGASAYSADTQKAPPPGRDLLRILACSSEIENAVFCDEPRCGGSLAQGAAADRCGQTRVDLARVASYNQTKNGRDSLNRKLVELLTGSKQNYAASGTRTMFDPNPLHELLARIAKRRPMLIITTNYDTLIEDAFDDREVPYEVMATPNDDYDAVQASAESDSAAALLQQPSAAQHGAEAGAIWHRLGSAQIDDDRTQRLPDGQSPGRFRRIAPDTFSRILESRSLIYKIHGTLRRTDADSEAEWDGDFLIAEEDYVRFLGRLSHPSALVPSAILAKLKARPDRAAAEGGGGKTPRSRMLFLGYGLNDWNMRVLLDSLGVGHGQPTDPKHYLIDRSPNALQSEILSKRDFKICAMDLKDFVTQLQDNCEEAQLIPKQPVPA